MKKQWNISLLVLFVLVACSLIGIMAVQYTKHIAIQTNQIHNYYKSYYLAKWWNEIGLSLLQIRWEWYSIKINENDDLVKDNINASTKFWIEIIWKNSLLSDWHPKTNSCTNKINISWGESLILPLFIDEPNNNINEHFSEQKYYSNKSYILKDIKIRDLETTQNIWIWIILSSSGTIKESGIFFETEIFWWENFFEDFNVKAHNLFREDNDPSIRNRQYDNDLQNYLIIANKNDTQLEFCLQIPWDNNLPLPKTYISSFWYSNWKKISLESIYKLPIPSYLIDSSIF